MSKTVLITGSTGFVGTNFIRNSDGFIISEADLLSTKVNEIDFSRSECVFHLAALVHQMNGKRTEEYFEINRDLAYEVAKKSKLQGVKHFVFMSTVKVYGESNTNKLPWNEDSKCQPNDPYGKSKLEAEKLIQNLGDKQFKVAIIRSPLIYGPGVKANMYNLIKIIDQYPLLPFGGIQNKRSMVYVGNLIALSKVIIDKTASGIFLAGDRESISTSSLVHLIAINLNKRMFLIKPPKAIISFLKYIKPSTADRIWGSLELDNSNSNKKLGFTPPFSTEMGIQEMISWYQDEKLNVHK